MKKTFKKWYGECWDYLVESRDFVYSIFWIFVIAGVVGFAFADRLLFLEDIIRGLIERTQGLDAEGLIGFIFLNNVQSAFLGLILGVFLGVIPVFNALVNGAVIGFVMNGVASNTSILDFWRLLPHGIFELPAIFISLGLGVKLGMFVFARKRKKEFVRRLLLSLKVFVLVIVPLLVIAAVIEGLLIASGV